MRHALIVPSLISALIVVGCGSADDVRDPTTQAGGDDPTAMASSVGADLGNVDFQASCSAEVSEDFDRAVALLHHMMYQEARGAFEGIASRDPECAMAHWGVAMTLFQPLWPARPSAEDRQRGWEAVQRAKELDPGTERERALIAAAEAFYTNPEADEWWPRIERWSDALEEAHTERPEDLETRAFYGLSLLAVGQAADDQPAYNERAAEVLTEIHEREPLHPGAVHYTIHADDASGRADEHLQVVETYQEIAPSVPHALHMPSHIYVRLGEWPEVIDWNRQSAEAALEHSPEDWVSLHHIHALDYLLYAHLQEGDDARARQVLERALSVDRYQEDFASAFHLAVMPARYAVERRAWDEAAALTPREPDYLAWDRYLWPEALTWFARGLGAARTGDLAGAREAEARLVQLRDGAEEAGEQTFATYIEIDRLILSGWIAFEEGDGERAVDLMEEAARLEDTVEKSPITPGAVLPPREALGDLLRALERPEAAMEGYEASLEVWPARYRSVLGAARAAAAAGHDEEARSYYAALLDITEDGSERPGVAEARGVVGEGAQGG